MRTLPLLGLLVGCKFVTLDEVPIEGGSTAQQALVASELKRFDRQVGLGRVKIKAVKFGEGRVRFTHTNRTIHLDGTADERDLRWQLRHELCHAIDLGEGLGWSREPAFDELTEGMLGASGRHARREAMAIVCELGPAGAQLLASPCPEDPPVAAAAAWLNQNVWTGEVDEWTFVGRERGLSLPVDGSVLQPYAQAHPQLDWIRLHTREFDTRVHVETGSEIELDYPLPTREIDRNPSENYDFETEELLLAGSAAVMLGRYNLRGLGRSALRVKIFDLDAVAWAPVVGECPTSEDDILFAASTAYSVRMPTEADRSFRWWPLTVEKP